ncbi:hypothetical protein GCM10009603_27170 [Nocardiopsis exhalans]
MDSLITRDGKQTRVREKAHRIARSVEASPQGAGPGMARIEPEHRAGPRSASVGGEVDAAVFADDPERLVVWCPVVGWVGVRPGIGDARAACLAPRYAAWERKPR